MGYDRLRMKYLARINRAFCLNPLTALSDLVLDIDRESPTVKNLLCRVISDDYASPRLFSISSSKHSCIFVWGKVFPIAGICGAVFKAI